MSLTLDDLEKQLDSQVKGLRQKILQVFNGEKGIFSAKEQMGTYTMVYNYAIGKEIVGEPLYKLFQKYIRIFLSESLEIVRQGSLEEFQIQNSYFDKYLKQVHLMFRYLDTSYIQLQTDNEKKLSLKMTAHKIFDEVLIQNCYNTIVNLFLETITKDRESILDPIEMKKLNGIVAILLEKKDYNKKQKDHFMNEFESVIKENSNLYYQFIYHQASKLGIVAGIAYLSDIYVTEEKRLRYIFNERKIVEETLQQLKEQIEKFRETIQTDQLQEMMLNESYGDIEVILRSLRHLTNPLDNIKNKLELIFRYIGENAISTGAHEVEKLQQLINHQQKMKGVIIGWGDGQILRTVLNNSVEQNLRTFKALIETLLVFVNQMFLQKQQFQQRLQQFVDVFNCLDQKDVFLQYYQVKLAQRLLVRSTSSEIVDQESQLIKELNKICGSFTEVCEQLLQNYHNSQTIYMSQISQIEVKCRMLKQELWPSFLELNIEELPIISQLKEEFEEQFMKASPLNSQKNLFWSKSASFVTLSFRTDKTYQITVSMCLASILFEFQQTDVASIQEISSKYDFTDKLDKILAEPLKLKLLLRNGDELKFNSSFQCPKSHLHLLATLIPSKTLNQDVFDDHRVKVIEAAIVKLMKARRRLAYKDIIAEVPKLVTLFPPTATQIKLTIETLINKEYLGRDREHYDQLIYIS